jgi:hypothetical protein
MKKYTQADNLTVRRISKDLFKVTLSDGSRWKVREGDISKTACWYETQRITVLENEGPDAFLYPYRLKNLDTYSDEAEASLV